MSSADVANRRIQDVPAYRRICRLRDFPPSAQCAQRAFLKGGARAGRPAYTLAMYPGVLQGSWGVRLRFPCFVVFRAVPL